MMNNSDNGQNPLITALICHIIMALTPGGITVHQLLKWHQRSENAIKNGWQQKSKEKLKGKNQLYLLI